MAFNPHSHIVCTICSKEKDKNPGLLPPHERYTAPHIAAVRRIAERQGHSFFVLSGALGLLGPTAHVPHYDYQLQLNDIETMALYVARQIFQTDITRIDFYFEKKSSWEPYVRLMRRAVELFAERGTEVALIEHVLPETPA